MNIEYKEEEGIEPIGLLVREVERSKEGEKEAENKDKDVYNSIVEEVRWLSEKGYIRKEAEEDIMERLIGAVGRYVRSYKVITE